MCNSERGLQTGDSFVSLSCSTLVAEAELLRRLRTVGEGIEALHQPGTGSQLAHKRQIMGSGMVKERERRNSTLKKLCQ